MRGGVKLLIIMTLFVFGSLLYASDNPYSYPVSLVILDAGHGGHDPGTSAAWVFAGGTIYERDINLDIAKRVYSLLSVVRPDLQVVMTRDDDTFVSLAQRCKVAYSFPLVSKTSALFVSIHTNSSSSDAACGFEVLTKKQDKTVSLLNSETPKENISLLSPFSSIQLNRLLNNRNLVVAKTFEEVLSQKLITSKDRGVKEQDVYVLNDSRVPAVLVEVGFLSNEKEARNIVSPQWRHSVAEAIVQSIIQCL